MIVLSIAPCPQTLEYAGYRDGSEEPLFIGAAGDHHAFRPESWAASGSVDLIAKAAEAAGAAWPDAIILAAPFGGAMFRAPVSAAGNVLAGLQEMIPQSPMTIPPLLALIRELQARFHGVDVHIAFQTSFFADLPAREATYGILPDIMRSLEMRRYGYHGICHEAACAAAAAEHLRLHPGTRGPRLLSICLQPRPEIAAVTAGRPLMVSSGASPLEGMPGQTTCGELDPGIVLAMARDLNMGPEQIDRALTRESGILALAGAPLTLDQLFRSNDPASEPVREIIRYRMLQCCGAAMAAMGGVDRIVFSGRYAALGELFGPWLSERLRFRPDAEPAAWQCYIRRQRRILADIALRLHAASPSASFSAEIPR